MFERKSATEWLQEIESRAKELETPRDKLLLFAGSEADSRALYGKVYASLQARVVASSRDAGLVTIRETRLGRELEAAQLFHEASSGLTWPEAQKVWAFACARLCEQASGRVTALVRRDAPLHGIFFQTELPALLQNEKAERLNGISLASVRERGPVDSIHLDVGRLKRARELLADISARVELTKDALDQRIRAEAERARRARDLSQGPERTR